VRERFSRRDKLRPWDWSFPSENVPFRELITTIQNLWLIVQKDLMDDRLAKFVYDFCIESNRPYLDYIESYRIWRNYRVDLLIKSLKDTAEAFDFIEAVYEHLSEKYKEEWRERINEKLEDFNTLYRLNEEGLVEPIVSPEMEASLAQSKKLLKESKWAPAYKHLEKAKTLLFNRKKYDPCGSVGEAIKALESVARIITGEKLTLGKLSAEIGAKLNLPKPLDQITAIISKLWGYSSEKSRHGQARLPQVGFEEAEIILHMCSAWINYLIKRAESGGRRA
jgi:hypothetical protein